jgi:hypothetical protein
MAKFSPAQTAYRTAQANLDATIAEYRRELAAAGWRELPDTAEEGELDEWYAKWDPIDRRIHADCGVVDAYRKLHDAETNLLEWASSIVHRYPNGAGAAIDLAAAIATGRPDQRASMAKIALRLPA